MRKQRSSRCRTDIEAGQGSFALNRNVRIVAPADRRGQEIAAFLRDGIREQSGIALRIGAADRPAVASNCASILPCKVRRPTG